jgi:hypothetical protein
MNMLKGRDIQGKYLTDDEILAIEYYLMQYDCRTINGKPQITSIEYAGNVYKIEVIEPGKESLSYAEAPTHWVKSHIRDKKINQIIE